MRDEIKVEVKTPDRSMDLMMNRWLLYQTLACRVWARSAFYQASGAYGFRDQLQDVTALTISQPEITREHLLRSAAQLFVEGDVLHLVASTPTGKGVRTRISDDRVWLPFSAARYIEVTGDLALLDEGGPFYRGARCSVPTSTNRTSSRRFLHRAPVSSNIARGHWTRVSQWGSHQLPP